MHMLRKWEKRYVHYPTDVLGGALAGSISGYLGYRFIQVIFYRIEQEGEIQYYSGQYWCSGSYSGYPYYYNDGNCF